MERNQDRSKDRQPKGLNQTQTASNQSIGRPAPPRHTSHYTPPEPVQAPAQLISDEEQSNLLTHEKINNNEAVLNRLVELEDNYDSLSRLLGHALVVSGEALADALALEGIRNGRQLFGMLKNAHVGTRLAAGDSLAEAMTATLDKAKADKAAKKANRKDPLEGLTPEARALFTDPKKIWGRSESDLRRLLVNDENWFEEVKYDGDSKGFKFVKGTKGSFDFLEIRVNYGGGLHYPQERMTPEEAAMAADEKEENDDAKEINTLPWYYAVLIKGKSYRLVKKEEIAAFRGGDIYEDKYIVIDGPSGEYLKK